MKNLQPSSPTLLLSSADSRQHPKSMQNNFKIQAFGQCELGRQAGETDENTFSLVCCTNYNTTM